MLSPSLDLFMNQMLDKNPAIRPSFEMLESTNWILENTVDKSKIYSKRSSIVVTANDLAKAITQGKCSFSSVVGAIIVSSKLRKWSSNAQSNWKAKMEKQKEIVDEVIKERTEEYQLRVSKSVKSIDCGDSDGDSDDGVGSSCGSGVGNDSDSKTLEQVSRELNDPLLKRKRRGCLSSLLACFM